MSLGKYELLPDVLHPRVILDIAIKRLPEKFIATEIFPERSVEDITYDYVEWKPTWKMAPSRAEIAEARLAPALPYAPRAGVGCIEYSEKFFATDREVKLARRDTIADRIEAVGAMIALRQEYLFINELLTNPNIQTFATTARWDVATTDILDDIGHAEELIEEATGVTPDSLIVCSHDYRSLLKNDDVRELIRGRVLDKGLKQSVGMILPDIDVFKEINKQDTTLLLDDSAIVMKRQVETGAFHVFEPLSTRRWTSEDPVGIWVRLWKTLGFDLFDPEKVCVITNTKT